MARKFKKKITPGDGPAPKANARSWAEIGVDISVMSLTGVGVAFDAVLNQMRGPGYYSIRWERDTHFLDRLAQVTKSDFILEVLHSIGPFSVPIENVYIAVEEAWPAGIVKRADSAWLRQQAQIHGAFVGGLVRWGFTNVFEINNQLWKNPIRDEREQVGEGRGIDKWDVKEWAMAAYGLPDLPDLIKNTKRGLIPRPDNSRAKAVQPDDLYDAAGILSWMQNEHAEIMGSK